MADWPYGVATNTHSIQVGRFGFGDWTYFLLLACKYLPLEPPPTTVNGTKDPVPGSLYFEQPRLLDTVEHATDDASDLFREVTSGRLTNSALPEPAGWLRCGFRLQAYRKSQARAFLP
jgi:hypothetical protein